MKGHDVLCVRVDAFDDIDLAIRRPVRSYCPECRPCTTDPTWHMSKIEDDQPMIVGILAGEADTTSTRSRRDIGEVDAHVCCTVVCVDEAGSLSTCLIDVVDISLGRIRTGEEVKVVEEVIDVVIML